MRRRIVPHTRFIPGSGQNNPCSCIDQNRPYGHLFPRPRRTRLFQSETHSDKVCHIGGNTPAPIITTGRVHA